MFLLLMGTSWLGIGLIALVMVAVGRLIFLLVKKILRKTMKDASDTKVRLLATLSAWILSPLLVIGSLGLLVYVAIKSASNDTVEETEKSDYELMEADLKRDLTPGMTRTQVTKILGDTDTTQSVLVFDLSQPGTKEKYVLEVTFDSTGLTTFRRHRQR